MNEYIVFEVSLKNKKGYTVSLYKSPSQSHHMFWVFLSNFGQLLPNITIKKQQFVLIMGAFNAESVK